MKEETKVEMRNVEERKKRADERGYQSKMR
jgi:hypothetical protein